MLRNEVIDRLNIDTIEFDTLHEVDDTKDDIVPRDNFHLLRELMKANRVCDDLRHRLPIDLRMSAAFEHFYEPGLWVRLI